VVTKNIPPYSVAVGIPARVISQRSKQDPIKPEELIQKHPEIIASGSSPVSGA
jgi:serine acetyltransferase